MYTNGISIDQIILKYTISISVILIRKQSNEYDIAYKGLLTFVNMKPNVPGISN